MAHPLPDLRAHSQFSRLLNSCADEDLRAERAIEEAKRRTVELSSNLELEVANLERLKQTRCAADEEVRKLRVELETAVAAVSFKQAKIKSRQQEIFQTNELTKKLEEEELTVKNTFVTKMMEVNSELRKVESAYSGSSLRRRRQTKRSRSQCEADSLVHSRTAAGQKRNDEQLKELLHKISGEEAVLRAMTDNLARQQKEVRDCREAHENRVSEEKRNVTRLRSESAELEERAAFLAAKLREFLTCSVCGTDNIDQASGQASRYDDCRVERSEERRLEITNDSGADTAHHRRV